MPSSRHPLIRAICAALVLSLLVCSMPALAAGAKSSTAKSTKPKAKAPVASAASLAEAQSQATAARAKLAQMRGSLSSGMSAFNGASNDLAKTRGRIAENTRALAKVQASLKSGQRSLSTQAEFLYRTNGTGFVDVLLGASTFDEFAARLSLMQTIASKDAGLVSTLKQDRLEAQSIIADLKTREAEQATQVSKVAAHRDAVQASVDQQQAYLSSLSSLVQKYVAAQEKAAQQAAANNSGSGGSGGSGGGSSSGAASPAPPSSSGVKLVTVTGRSGKWYAMDSDSSVFSATGDTFSGEASVYSVADNGTGTSSGRPLRDSELTCAHPSLPFGTRIAVSHNGHRVIVVVTDRGPYTGGRVIDLTPRGASLLNIDGIGQVKCEIVRPQ